jgi:cytochrome c nitrite reductase small subunit
MNTQKRKPPGGRRLWFSIVLGTAIGLAGYIFYMSNAASYLSDDPETCINCHIMTPEYATWSHSSHREHTTCNDCHVPHDNVFNKYYFKAKDGMRHATVFTMRAEPQVIFIKEAGKQVVHENCVRCHSFVLKDEKLIAATKGAHYDRSARECWDCHREVPHGRVHSLTATPNARAMQKSTIVPEWINNEIEKAK